jgi:lysophospholipase L1-like esterase
VNKDFKKIVSKLEFPIVIVGTTLLILILIFLPKNKSVESHRKSIQEPLWFVNFKDNRIEYKSSANLSQKFTQLISNATKGIEPLRVLHIGDSHIQADFFTGETRRLLSTWLADTNTSRGFTFPYQIVASNNPDDFNVEWKGTWIRNRTNGPKMVRLGVAGISVSTSDRESEFKLSLTKSKNGFKPFDSVKIYFEADDPAVVPYPVLDTGIVERGIGFITYKLSKAVNDITIGVNWNSKTDGSFTLFGFDLINSDAKIVYHAAGVNGASVRTFLQSENLATQAAQINPHVLILSLGTNDTYNTSFKAREFKRDFTELVKRLKDSLPQSLIILTTPGDYLVDKLHPSLFVMEAQKQIFSVARELDCGVWDFYSVMGGHGSIGLWAQLGLCAPDKLHLNRNGYKLQGALLFDALVKLTGDSPTLIIDNPAIVHE